MQMQRSMLVQSLAAEYVLCGWEHTLFQIVSFVCLLIIQNRERAPDRTGESVATKAAALPLHARTHKNWLV